MNDYYFEVLDSGALNQAMLGYCELAAYRAGLDDKTRDRVRREFYFALDEYTAKEANDVYMNGIPDHEAERRRRMEQEASENDD